MKALLRYAFMKSSRDQLLARLALAPFIILGAPLLGATGGRLVRGRATYPISLDSTMSVAATATVLGLVAVVFATVVAATGSFLVFRREIETRAVGLFFLAGQSQRVVLAAALCGFTAGAVSYLGSIGLILIATTHLPAEIGRHVLAAIAASMSCAMLGAMLATVSPERGMLLPVYAAAITTSVWLLGSAGLVAPLAALATAAALALVAPNLMRHRCAA